MAVEGVLTVELPCKVLVLLRASLILGASPEILLAWHTQLCSEVVSRVLNFSETMAHVLGRGVMSGDCALMFEHTRPAATSKASVSDSESN